MNTGFTTRRISIVVFIFFVSALFAKPTLYMEVKRLNDNVQVTKSYMNLFIMAHEVVGLEFIGHFGNDSRKLDYICKLRRNPSSEPFPD